MAKRKRLTPANTAFLSQEPEGSERSSHTSSPPIAQVVEESSEAAALSALSDELHTARQEGRMIERLPLSRLKDDFLVRDRITMDGGELESLVTSLRERGQQTPIDVTKLSDNEFGLISGWRRVTALRRLFKETDNERFSTVLAIVRKPDASSDAYRAMVEENEIRLGLSYYERARIAAKATEQGVFSDNREALKTLYAAASRAKRSKISSFMEIYYALDGCLKFPKALPERQGLLLAKALKGDKKLARRLNDRLRKTPATTAEAELKLLENAVSKLESTATKSVSERQHPSKSKIGKGKGDGGRQNILIEAELGEVDPLITIRGVGVDEAFLSRLRKWVEAQV
ncbi:ParB/RepB/Spo0J family partition protein [Shimia abyssi]|uniref:ParB-like nuclease family protein n=1 Tax=Shimia abyssi TaxID=1662395 RepID=A0A2P8F7E0_9RHOB|nr:ParB N-terminal domain-containing protein [Shimia abyssi]PSL17592.1 ParB-like nuclease family protein [Shimia abyssi]